MRVTPDIPLSLYEIAAAINSKALAVSNKYIKAVCTDTREAEENDLFVALSGEKGDGEEYIEEAKKKNCFPISARSRDGALKVEDTASALLDLAKYYKSKLNTKYTVAVTGSVGKSTTVKFLKKILAQKYKVHTPIGNFNNHIGVPLTVLSAPRDTEIIICELGMNHRNEISRLSKCINPDIGIITSVGSAHIGNLGSREEIARAKLEILDGMNGGALILPKNEPLLSNVENAYRVGYNTSLSHFYLTSANGNCSVIFKGETIKELNFFNNRNHLIADLSYAISVAVMLDMSENEIRKGIESIDDNDLRQRFIPFKDFTVFDDSYNASVESMVADFKYISSLNKPTGAFLGDILELGEASKRIHETIGERAAEFNVGNLYLYGVYAKDTERGAIRGGMDPKSIHVNTDISSPEISIAQILSNHKDGEIILFKASHKLRLDKIADIIKEKEGMSNERS